MKRIQNVIAESRWTLSFVLPVCFTVWGLVAFHDAAVIVPGIMMLLSTILMMNLNNSNSLIRIFSRMVSCSFIILATLDAHRFSSTPLALVMLGGVGFFTSAFPTYQRPNTPGHIFYAFLSIGIASIAWVQMLYFLPLLWVIMRMNLLSMSPRNFFASLFGIVCPYWFMLVYFGATDNLLWFVRHFHGLVEFEQPLQIAQVGYNEWLSLGLIMLCSFIGMIHYANQKRSDSIRTRLFYQSFITLTVAIMAFIFLQPQHMGYLQGLLIVTTAPLIGHFFALTRTRYTNWMFLFLWLASSVITLINLWIVL